MTEAIALDVRMEPCWAEALPEAEAVALRAAAAVGAVTGASGEAALLLTDDAALQALNARHRGKDAPTNVLAFPAAPPPAPNASRDASWQASWEPHLGDIAIALETLRREAAAEGKSLEAHLAHLVAHGLLHLLGHDHEDERDAQRMEAMERAALARIGVADPYSGETR